MSFTNAKDASKHTNHTITNNGGVLVSSTRGSTPENAVGTKFTENPEESGGVNKEVKESNYIGGWSFVQVVY